MSPTSQSTLSQVAFKNQFSNDGSFLEQFKKLKKSKDEPKFEPKFEPKVEVKDKSVEDEWYKAALARAKSIAQNISAPPVPTVKSESQGPSLSTGMTSDPSGKYIRTYNFFQFCWCM